MSFSEKTWVTGDIITADLLNRLEQALASHDTNITGLLSNLGDLTQLSTSSKGNLVAALNEVKGIIPVGGSGGSGSLVYNTLTDLQNAYPSGTTQPAWVIADNAWYYWSGTAAVSAPADVTGLATSSVTSTSLSLSWIASSGATSYDVYQGSTLLGNTTSTSYSVSGLNASTAYTFKVIAKNSGGSAPGTGSGASTSVTTLVAAPANVTGLATSNVTQTSLTLSWTGSTGATSYDVYNGSTLLGNTTSATYNATGLTAGTSYTFKVVAKNAGGSSTGATVNATTAVAIPADVTNLATSNISNSSVTLTWTASSGATSYDVYNGATLLGNTTSVTYQATGLSSSTAYTFKVVAKNAVGSSAGATINVTTLATAPNPVTALTVGTIQPSTVAVSWTAPSGGSAVDHYEVAYEASGATSYTVSSNAVNSSSTSFTVTGLHQSTAYTIRVVAIDASGNRSQATTVSATTIALTASASPASGTFTSSQTVTLSSNGVTGTNIYYTTDGSTPTTSSTLYSAAITVSATETIKFFAQNPVGDQSAVQSATYTINLPDTTAPTVTASPAAGTYTSAQTVTLSATDPDNTAAQITIYYTTDGSTPTYPISGTTTTYTTPLSVGATETIKFIGVDTAGNVSSVQSALYTINLATVLASDNFTRANSTTTLGTSSGGQTWNALVGTWGIKSNEAYLVTNSGNGGVAVIDAGAANGTVSFKVGTGGFGRIIFRAKDGSNYYEWRTGIVYRWQNGGFTNVASTSVNPAVGDTVKVIMNGTSVSIYNNSTLVATITDSTFNTATQHGIGTSTANGPTFANFQITNATS